MCLMINIFQTNRCLLKCSVSCIAGLLGFFPCDLRLRAGGTYFVHTSYKSAHKQDRTKKKRNMLHLLGTVVGLLIIIMCFSKGLKEGICPKKIQYPESSANSMKDLSEEDVHLLAKILSVGLVDADPNYLHHLKGYRDLHGA
ncbi:hypothetical protein EPR50_G00175990 [Perca flavescens]|uniref:Uncharacterized protein n=1 Tax=Perca flavescens TaxID=8167 RepID=A0A484CAR3_PERFV|nr:hypothetical protein EPR50_G00175990 [Perca flavescens]